ncbi:MAG TPA: sulfite exporter TauE/SafE family protein [bacterium]|nr:sulfite exporter TauE/SafE family protein [bacterium]
MTADPIALTPAFAALLFAAASVAGFLGALLGVGGGIIVVPAMVLGFGLPMKIAVAASVVSVIATSNAGGSSYVDQRISNLRLAMILEIPTTVGALGGAVLALVLSEWILLLLFALLLGVMSWNAFASRNTDAERIARGDYASIEPDRFARKLRLRGSYHDQAAKKDVEYVVTGIPAGVIVSLLAGAASGLLGVGGGVLKVSAMNHYMNVPMKVAVGTSKLMIGVTAAIGALLFFLAGMIHVYVVAPVALGTTAGATVGTHVMNRLHAAVLKWVFALLMAYLAWGMIAKALALRFDIHLPSLAV